MRIFEALNNTLKEAMLARDQKTLDVVRAIKARLAEYQVTNGLDRSKIPDDIHMIKVLRAYKKSLERGISQLKKGGEAARPLINSYKEEIEFCELYLPDAAAQKEAIVKVIDDAMKSPDLRNVPVLIKHIMTSNPHFDGKIVKDIVSEKLRR